MAGGSSRRSGRMSGEVATMRKERRFEDIVSDEEGEEDVMPAFLQKGKQSSTQANKNSPPRKPRSTLHEQIGEDGFIFSKAVPTTSKSTKTSIPGAKGPPPTQITRSHQATVREKIAEAETPIIRRNQPKRAQVDGLLSSISDDEQFRPSETNKRQPSDSVKRIRRTSQLQDGTPAYPHPSISDEDLHNYCSGDLEPQERMRHVAGWILERRRKEFKVMLQGESAKAYRGPLLAALKMTLRDLNKGAVQTRRSTSREKQQQTSSSSSSTSGTSGTSRKRKKLPAHPRNEANREKRTKLEEVVRDLKGEKLTWEKEQKELDKIKKETDGLARSEDNEATIDHILDSLEKGSQWSSDDRKCLERVKKALELERNVAMGKSIKGKGNDLLGTENDARWKDVEFNADLLRSKAHTFAQLSSLSQRYIAAVSARGAKALKEMTQGPTHKLHTLQIGGSTSSTISRESRDNLDQILSEIRTITDEGSDEKEVPERGHAVGDVSEGDILRAYAQMS